MNNAQFGGNYVRVERNHAAIRARFPWAARMPSQSFAYAFGQLRNIDAALDEVYPCWCVLERHGVVENPNCESSSRRVTAL
jgi:hypothetical protein